MKAQTIPVLLAACLALSASSAIAGPRSVDCDEGDSLQVALDAGAGSAAPIEILVTDTCQEDLRVERNRVTILGDGLTTIDGRIRVFSVDNLVIRDLTVTGGISLWSSRTRFFFDMRIVDNGGTGILAADNSSVNCTRCTINGNREGMRLNSSRGSLTDTSVDFNNLAGEFSDGILVLQNSSLESVGGSISGNGNLGIRANWNSSIFVRGTQIESNGAYGIQMYNASGGDLTNARVLNNAGFGIEPGSNSALDMYGGDEASIDVAAESTVGPFECSGFWNRRAAPRSLVRCGSCALRSGNRIRRSDPGRLRQG